MGELILTALASRSRLEHCGWTFNFKHLNAGTKRLAGGRDYGHRLGRQWGVVATGLAHVKVSQETHRP